MWRIKLRETLERLTVLDCKPWTCGSQKVQQQTTSSTASNTTSDNCKDYINCAKIDCNDLEKLSRTASFGPEIFFPTWTKCCNRNSTKYSSHNFSNGNQKTGEKNRGDRNELNDDILGAITWSGAIICGWYASQILCLRRRHVGWGNADQNHQNKFLKYLHLPTKAIHSNILSHLVFTSPPTKFQRQQQKVFFTVLSERVENEEIAKLTVDGEFQSDSTPIQAQSKIDTPEDDTSSSSDDSSSDDSSSDDRRSKASFASSTSISKKQTVKEAVSDLVNYIAENEYKVALLYLKQKDYTHAITHLKLASNHRHPSSVFNLGVCFENGLGVKRNLQRAMEYYQLASRLGHPKATYNLGVFYGRGLGGLQKNDNLAKKCIIAAAKLGQPEAKSCLNEMAIYDEEIAKFIKSEENSLIFRSVIL